MTFLEWFYKVIILQGICVLLIILSLLAVKYFLKAEFKKVQTFYNDNIVVDTDVNEVLSNAV